MTFWKRTLLIDAFSWQVSPWHQSWMMSRRGECEHTNSFTRACTCIYWWWWWCYFRLQQLESRVMEDVGKPPDIICGLQSHVEVFRKKLEVCTPHTQWIQIEESQFIHLSICCQGVAHLSWMGLSKEQGQQRTPNISPNLTSLQLDVQEKHQHVFRKFLDMGWAGDETICFPQTLSWNWNWIRPFVAAAPCRCQRKWEHIWRLLCLTTGEFEHSNTHAHPRRLSC